MEIEVNTSVRKWGMYCVLLGIISADGCAAPDPAPFSVRIEQWALVAGYAKAYSFTNSGIEVEALNDFGDPPRRIWTTTLSKEQQMEFVARLRKVPIASLEDSYIAENVCDGILMRIQLDFEEQVRRIHLQNEGQKNLEAFVGFVNSLLPVEHRIEYFDIVANRDHERNAFDQKSSDADVLEVDDEDVWDEEEGVDEWDVKDNEEDWE